jgi:crotonobetainyl-CoA:carnitine CoA-transferase CaiB-like acyl-CoA transferase
MAQQPLDGITVVDLTRYLAGPFCTQILGDYGAEILKIEPVEKPRGELGDSSAKDSYFFLSANRSKKSVRIAIKKPRGREMLLRLCDRADVVVDNFRPGVMKAMGLDYDQLSGLRLDRPTAGLPGLRSNRAGNVRPDERDRYRG